MKISRLGRVTIGPLRTFEVFPDPAGGEAYKRLIAVEGERLSAEELARRDAEHQRDVQKARRQEGGQDERQRRESMLADALAVYEIALAGRDRFLGEPVFIVDVRPRRDAPVRTREGRWMKRFAGQILVSETNAQVLRLDMRAIEDVTIGWGVVGRIHDGSRVRFSRQQFDKWWVPAELTYEASGRTLLFRPFQFSVTTTYTDYRRHEQPR